MGINKLLEKQKNYKNFLNKQLKNPSLINNFLLSSLIINIIFTLFHSFIIYYLVNLKKCLCFEESNNKNYSNINYLIIIESLALVSFILASIASLILMFYKSQKGGGDNKKISHTVFYITYGIILLINFYFLYNVKKLAENVKEDCECSHSWIRYLLYIYSIYMVLIIISGIITLFFMN